MFYVINYISMGNENDEGIEQYHGHIYNHAARRAGMRRKSI